MQALGLKASLRALCLPWVFVLILSAHSFAQPVLKKIRLGNSSTNVGFLPLYAAYHKGFYRDEGIDLEIISMSATLASTAVLMGELDYNAASTGVIVAAVRGQPMKMLIFTVARPLSFLMSKKDLKEPRQLKGKKIAGSSPGGTATLLAEKALRHFGLEPGRDVAVLPMAGTNAARLAVLESGVVDASLVSVPENIYALEKGYNELIFLGDIVEFPTTGFGTSEKKIHESPAEILKMIRATLRGLLFITDKSNRDGVLDIIMKQWKVADRKMASEIFNHVSRVLTKDAKVSPEGIQLHIDLARETAKVSRPATVAQVVDFTFLDQVRKDLGIAR